MIEGGVSIDIIIREAVIEDYSELCKVYAELDEYHRFNHPELFIKPDDYARAKEYISEIIDDNSKALLVAIMDTKVIGFAECNLLKSSNFPVIKKREWIQLDSIVVRSTYQNCHVASSLLAKVIEWAKSKEVNRVELKVYSFNRNAIEFYSGKGFKELNRTMYLNL